MQHRTLFASLLAGALALTSFSSLAAPAKKEAHSSDEPAKKAAKPPDAKTNAKFNRYIEMMNKETRSLIEARNVWAHSMKDPKAGPTCKDDVHTDARYGSDFAERIDQYRKQFKAKPKLETDEAALQMAQALDDLQQPTKDAEEALAYGKKNGPERCEKVQKAHAQLMSAWHKYFEGLEKLEPYVEAFTDERDQREVDSTLKKYGRHYRYHFARIVLVSKSLLEKSEKVVQSPDANTAGISRRIGRLTDVVDETKELIKSDKEAKKDDTYPETLGLMVTDAMPGYQKQAKALVDTLNDANKRKDLKVLKAAWKDFTDAYNKLVEAMNAVEFRKWHK
jgi:tetratricopeptide (TPR) repeat protein